MAKFLTDSPHPFSFPAQKSLDCESHLGAKYLRDGLKTKAADKAIVMSSLLTSFSLSIIILAKGKGDSSIRESSISAI